MITGIHIRNFKSIAEVRLALRPLTVLYGKGGSGKSNLVEALLTAASLAGGLTVEEALAEHGLHTGAAGWGGVRGGADAAARRTAAGTKGPINITIEGTTHVPDANGDEQPTAWRFSVAINAASRQLVNDAFTAGRPIYERDENAGGKSNEKAALRARAGIAQLSRGPIELPLHPGDRLTLVTRSIHDAPNSMGTRFGGARIAATLLESGDRPEADLSNAIVDRAQHWTKRSGPPETTMTAITIEMPRTAASAPPKTPTAAATAADAA